MMKIEHKSVLQRLKDLRFALFERYLEGFMEEKEYLRHVKPYDALIDRLEMFYCRG